MPARTKQEGGSALSTPPEPRPETDGNVLVARDTRRLSVGACPGRTLGVSPFGVVAAAFAVCLAVGQAPASAYQLPPVAGVGYPNVPVDRGKKLSAFFGYSFGNDSNILRAASGSETADYFHEALVGIIYLSGLPTRSFELRYEGKLDFFLSQTSLNHMDHVIRTGIVRQTEATNFTLQASGQLLSQSDEIEAEGQLNKMRLFVMPDLALRKGQIEFVGGGSAGLSIYADKADSDFLDIFGKTELRLWRGETKHYFAHFDVGRVDYGTNFYSDFNCQRLYLGMRSERTERSGLEISLGVQGNDVTSFSVTAEEFFASVRYTRQLGGGRSALSAGYTRGGEASLLSDYKSVDRATARYSYAASTRLSLSAGVTWESASFANKETVPAPPAPPGDMTRFIADVGAMYEIGSPERLHGRLFASYGLDSRTGPSNYSGVDYNYGRARWFGGVALVY